MKNYVLTLSFLFFFNCLFSQTVGINSTGAVPATSAMLDVASTSKGLLIPRVDIIDLSTATPVTAPTISLLVYNTNVTSGIGYYFWNGTIWVRLLDDNSIVSDHDWYEVGGANSPDNISDDIYTNGHVGIGVVAPQALMHLNYTTDASLTSVNHPLTIGVVTGDNIAIDNNEILARNNGGIANLYLQNEGAGHTIINRLDGNVGVGVATPLEKLDVNGDIYLRGDDMYFSNDAVPNTNNDYVHFNDINTLNFGGKSIFSFHADVPRNDPAHDWSNPTGSISFDGAYATGKIGVNTTDPQASLDIENGYAVSDRFWYRDYINSTTASPQVVLDRDGNPLPNNFVGMLYCSITGTNTAGTSYWMVKRRTDGVVHIERIASFGSTGTTTPEIYNDAGVIKIRPYSTTNVYTIRVRTEQMW